MLEASDHRILGQQLDLFHLQEEAPGMVFWHPRGYAMYRALESAVRSWTVASGFEEVKTPELHTQRHLGAKRALGELSPAHVRLLGRGQERGDEARELSGARANRQETLAVAPRSAAAAVGVRHRAPRRTERRAARPAAPAPVHPRRRTRVSGRSRRRARGRALLQLAVRLLSCARLLGDRRQLRHSTRAARGLGRGLGSRRARAFERRTSARDSRVRSKRAKARFTVRSSNSNWAIDMAAVGSAGPSSSTSCCPSASSSPTTIARARA